MTPAELDAYLIEHQNEHTHQASVDEGMKDEAEPYVVDVRPTYSSYYANSAAGISATPVRRIYVNGGWQRVGWVLHSDCTACMQFHMVWDDDVTPTPIINRLLW